MLLLAAALQVTTVTGYGPVGAYLTERFPDEIRASGYGVAYSISIVLPALYPTTCRRCSSCSGRTRRSPRCSRWAGSWWLSAGCSAPSRIGRVRCPTDRQIAAHRQLPAA